MAVPKMYDPENPTAKVDSSAVKDFLNLQFSAKFPTASPEEEESADHEHVNNVMRSNGGYRPTKPAEW